MSKNMFKMIWLSAILVGFGVSVGFAVYFLYQFLHTAPLWMQNLVMGLVCILIGKVVLRIGSLSIDIMKKLDGYKSI